MILIMIVKVMVIMTNTNTDGKDKSDDILVILMITTPENLVNVIHYNSKSL